MSQRNVEQYLLSQLEDRDKEIVELKRQVVKLQCTVIELQQNQQQPAVATPSLPQILLEGVSGTALSGSSTLGAHQGRTPSVSSVESNVSEMAPFSAPATPDHVPSQSGKVTVVSRSAEEPSSRFLLLLLTYHHILDKVLHFLPENIHLLRTHRQLHPFGAQHTAVSLQVFKAYHTLEPGVPNESAYELLDGTLARRKKMLFPKSLAALAANRLHHFTMNMLKPHFNTIAFNVNNPANSFKNGPPGMLPENNAAVANRGLNVAVFSTLHSSTSGVDYTAQFRWMKDRRIRLIYPRAAVPHMLGMLECVKKLCIQPTALVIDVCLVKPKWFPAIEFIREYPNIILVPEIPSKEALEEGEAQHIKEKFNRYLESFTTAGQCIYVVLDESLLEVSKEIRTSKVNVLTLRLPEKEGPTGLKEYPLLELLGVLDSVFDDDFTLTVPEEREALVPGGAFGAAPGAGGVYKYTASQVFSYVPSRRRQLPHVADDDEGISDSSSYSVSSVSSVGSSGYNRGGSSFGTPLFKASSLSGSTGRSRMLSRGRHDRKSSLPRRASVPVEESVKREVAGTQKVAEDDGFTLCVTNMEEVAADVPVDGGDVVLQLPGDNVAARSCPSVAAATAEPKTLLFLENTLMVATCDVGSSFIEEAGLQPGTCLMDKQACFALLADLDAKSTPVDHNNGTVLLTGRVAQHVAASLPSGVTGPSVTYWGVGRDDGTVQHAASEGISVHTIPDEAPSVCLCTVGETDSVLSLSTACSEGTAIPSFQAAVNAADVITIDSLFLVMPREDLTAMVQRCEAEGKEIVLRVDAAHLEVVWESFEAILPYVGLLFADQKALVVMAEKLAMDAETLRDLLRKVQARIKPTGTFFLIENTLAIAAASPTKYHMTPFPAVFADLRTARDPHAIFIGGFLSKYSQRKETDACIKAGFRQVVASLKADYPLKR